VNARAGDRARAEAWLEQDPDPETRAELRTLLDDPAALAERFGAKLEFGTAGMRGELGAGPNRMNRVTVMRAAAGIASVLTETATPGTPASVVIGYDARHKSDIFAEDSAAVLGGAGVTVYLMPGPLPTPVLAYAVRHLGCDAGIMVTASHNPPRDNGYKVYWGDGAQIIPPIDQEISRAIDAVGRVDTLPRGSWRTLDGGIVEAYLHSLSRLPIGTHRDVSVAYTPLHGVGGAVLRQAFDRCGFVPPEVVREQADPDPDFPTVAFPNPEEPGAMDLALALGNAHGSDLVIANDPDADRCAVAAGGRMLTGDEVGGLLAEHVLRHTDGDDRLVVTTIVSSSLLGKIAEAHGVRYAETLTGFKWIMKGGNDGDRLVFGYEEALGYSVGGDDGVPVRDKDGVGAALTVAGLAAEAKAEGRTLLDLLEDQARRYGLHATAQVSFRVKDLSVIADAMTRLRAAPPRALAGHPVTSVEDLSGGLDGLPPADVLRLRLSGGGRVIVRPSGTEPKLKCYLEVVVPGGGEEARTTADAELDGLRTAVTEALGL
jgi:phosphomannomutase